MNKITAVIITLNEERNIVRCIKSVEGLADDVLVVDSGSTDRTVLLAQQCGAKVVFNEWKDYSSQKNFANSHVDEGWILSLDADEALSEALRQSLISLKNDRLSDGVVYAFNRLNGICGQWVHHSGWYPDRKVRLWKVGTAVWDGIVHEELRFTMAVNVVVVDGDLLHYTYDSIQDFASRQVKYAVLAGKKAFENGKRCSLLTLRLKQWWSFVRCYIFRGGFRDGWTGYQVCRMSAFYTHVKYSVLMQLQRQSKDD
ncbi:MAG: glycosyltransferase family 2 protein [Bacteroidales bacterium]|nr:glycosyltransferase family 2 protein [Bacteroidales bacterium]